MVLVLSYSTFNVIRMLTFSSLFIFIITCNLGVLAVLEIETTKVFIMPIDYNSFNWSTSDVSPLGYSFRASLTDAPDLPSWLSYSNSQNLHLGFLYGVPPSEMNAYNIEIIATNKRTYETQRKIININVKEKQDPARFEVQLKIDNVNLEDMIEKGRLERLMDVFKRVLWPQSQSDLYVTFLESALKMGARKPLRPNESDGVVLRLGSQSGFSKELMDLQEEVRPLWKLSSCPRDFKRTTVDRHFRAGSFALDWCSFRLAGSDEASIGDGMRSDRVEDDEGWEGFSRNDLLSRNFSSDALASLLLPTSVLLIMGLLLSLVLCFHHEGITDPSSDRFFDSLIFCDEYFRNKECEDSEETLTQFEAVQRATNSLRSMSAVRDPSPRLTGDTNESGRPNPPPYTAVRRNRQLQDS